MLAKAMLMVWLYLLMVNVGLLGPSSNVKHSSRYLLVRSFGATNFWKMSTFETLNIFCWTFWSRMSWIATVLASNCSGVGLVPSCNQINRCFTNTMIRLKTFWTTSNDCTLLKMVSSSNVLFSNKHCLIDYDCSPEIK